MCHAWRVAWEDTTSEVEYLLTAARGALCAVSRTVASAFFKPTTCGEVGGHVSWSRHCFSRSLSVVSEPRADFMVACTAAAGEKKKKRQDEWTSWRIIVQRQTIISVWNDQVWNCDCLQLLSNINNNYHYHHHLYLLYVGLLVLPSDDNAQTSTDTWNDVQLSLKKITNYYFTRLSWLRVNHASVRQFKKAHTMNSRSLGASFYITSVRPLCKKRQITLIMRSQAAGIRGKQFRTPLFCGAETAKHVTKGLIVTILMNGNCLSAINSRHGGIITLAANCRNTAPGLSHMQVGQQADALIRRHMNVRFLRSINSYNP